MHFEFASAIFEIVSVYMGSDGRSMSSCRLYDSFQWKLEFFNENWYFLNGNWNLLMKIGIFHMQIGIFQGK